MCGPPGIGKTTLAHVVAQHGRYNIVEINARLVAFTEGPLLTQRLFLVTTGVLIYFVKC